MRVSLKAETRGFTGLNLGALFLELGDGNAVRIESGPPTANVASSQIFLGVLNDRTTDSFACIGKSGFITIRTTRNQQSQAERYKPFADGDTFGIRVTIPDKIQFCVNEEWSKVFNFSVGKLTTIYLSVRPILFEAEVVSLKMQQKKDFKLGKLPFRLRNVWPEGADRD